MIIENIGLKCYYFIIPIFKFGAFIYNTKKGGAKI